MSDKPFQSAERWAGGGSIFTPDGGVKFAEPGYIVVTELDGTQNAYPEERFLEAFGAALLPPA